MLPHPSHFFLNNRSQDSICSPIWTRFFFREDSGVPPLFPHTQGVGKRKARAVFCFFTRDIDDFPMKTGVIFQPVGSQQGRSKTGSDFRTLDFHEFIYIYISFFWWRIGLEIQNSKWMESRIGSKFKNDIFAAVHPAVTSRVPCVIR